MNDGMIRKALEDALIKAEDAHYEAYVGFVKGEVTQEELDAACIAVWDAQSALDDSVHEV